MYVIPLVENMFQVTEKIFFTEKTMCFQQHKRCLHSCEEQFLQEKICVFTSAKCFHRWEKMVFTYKNMYILKKDICFLYCEKQLLQVKLWFISGKHASTTQKNTFYRQKYILLLIKNMFTLFTKTGFTGKTLCFQKNILCLFCWEKQFLKEKRRVSKTGKKQFLQTKNQWQYVYTR